MSWIIVFKHNKELWIQSSKLYDTEKEAIIEFLHDNPSETWTYLRETGYQSLEIFF